MLQIALWPLPSPIGDKSAGHQPIRARGAKACAGHTHGRTRAEARPDTAIGCRELFHHLPTTHHVKFFLFSTGESMSAGKNSKFLAAE